MAIKRRVFYSFHFDADYWRTQQVRNAGVVEGNAPVSPNAWEEVKKKGDAAIREWIDEQLDGRSCAVVLIGSKTANRKWVQYEISSAWNKGKGVVGIHINKLEDQDGKQSTKGSNPLGEVTFKGNGKPLSSIAKTYTPNGTTGKEVYARIKEKIAAWVEEAIEIRKSN